MVYRSDPVVRAFEVGTRSQASLSAQCLSSFRVLMLQRVIVNVRLGGQLGFPAALTLMTMSTTPLLHQWVRVCPQGQLPSLAESTEPPPAQEKQPLKATVAEGRGAYGPPFPHSNDQACPLPIFPP